MYTLLHNMNLIILITLTAAYVYQVVFTVIGLVSRKSRKEPEASKLHRFAALICARNEENVIAQLVKTLKEQNYPKELFDIYVLADNCDDSTAAVAKNAGAFVYERQNKMQVGKGYALDYLIKKIKGEENYKPYDGYFIFDADNIVDPNFVNEMNKTFDTGKYDAITCYRNSKNFGANWISAGYSIWFLREARFINYPRRIMGTGCAVSGTGFLVSDKLIEENGGWPFHLLTEDIQFSINCAVSGKKIGYCDSAVVYDEQPTTFSQSWKQRLRWSKGFFQVDAKYLVPLLKGFFGKKGNRFTCYDMFMTIAPCTLLTISVLIFNIMLCAGIFVLPHYKIYRIFHEAIHYASWGVINFYIGMAIYALLVVLSEWKRINASAADKLKYIWLFPLFMATYIPITITALLTHVEWSEIKHHAAGDFSLTTSKDM